MKRILASGRGFIKRENDIVMYPSSKGREKSITSDNLEKIWSEMKFLTTKYNYSDLNTYQLLKQNNIAFDIRGSDWEDYQSFSRNIQNLSLFNIKNPYQYFKDIIQKKILIIGLGTVGSPLVTELSKFGFRDLAIIDGDKIENKNLTAQLNYSESDIGKYKAEVVSKKIKGVTTFCCEYVTKNNIKNIISKINPEIVFCCADDSSGFLQKLLISNTDRFLYSLFLTGYSQEELIIQHITKESKDVFLNYFDQQSFLPESEFISHNTGTIIKGMLTSSLAFNMFLQSIIGLNYDILFLNTSTNEIYLQNIKDLNLSEYEQKYAFRDIDYEISKINYLLDYNSTIEKEKLKQNLFEFNYYVYLRYHCNQTNLRYKYLNHYLNTIFSKISGSIKSDNTFNPNIIKLEAMKSKYYKENGLPSKKYRKNLEDRDELDNILQNYSNFVLSPNFTDLYNILLNSRKQHLNNISKKIIKRYGFDFIRFIKDRVSTTINTSNLTKYDLLEFEFIQSPVVSDSNAFEIIFNSINSKRFFDFTLNFRQSGFIDYLQRPQKTTKNITLFNPYSKTSKIIMTYDENMGGVMRLVHEIMHAYSYDLYKDRIDLDKLYKIPKFFWEIFAKIGELFVANNQEQESLFFRKSFYQYVFCYIDYQLFTLDKNKVTIEDVLDIKDEFCISIGLDPKLLEYTKYNFIDYNMLYSNHYYAYDSVFSDIIAFGMYRHCQISNYDFDQMISIASTISKIDINYLLNTFDLDINELIELYTVEINKFLKNNFLEDLKHDYFKEK